MSEQKSNKILIGLVVFTLILVIGLGATLAYYVFFKDNKIKSGPQQETVKVDEKIADVNEFLVNLADESKSFIKVKFVIAYDKKNKKLEKEIPEKMPSIRDSVITVLRDKKSSDFNNTDTNKNSMENIKKEIIEAINKNLENGKITNIYIQDIIIQ